MMDALSESLIASQAARIAELNGEKRTLEAKLARARKALEAIASCRSVVAGDCPDIALQALKEIDND